MIAGGVELHDEDVPRARADQRSATEVDRSAEDPGDDDVAGRVRRDGHRAIVARAACAAAPDVLAGAVDLRDEHVARASRHERRAAEVDGAAEVPGDDRRPRGVHGEPGGMLELRAAVPVAPERASAGARAGAVVVAGLAPRDDAVTADGHAAARRTRARPAWLDLAGRVATIRARPVSVIARLARPEHAVAARQRRFGRRVLVSGHDAAIARHGGVGGAARTAAAVEVRHGARVFVVVECEGVGDDPAARDGAGREEPRQDGCGLAMHGVRS